MTLHSIGKSDANRSNALPNITDGDNNRRSLNTISTTYRTESTYTSQRLAMKNGILLYYDDQNRVIKIDGFEPRLVNYPVTIEAQYGYDVYADILMLPPPTV